MSNKTFHQTLCVELVYSQSGLLRGAPPWARPRWRSRWSSVASRRGRKAAGWRWCRWRLKAAGSGPPDGRTFLYNTWLQLLFFFHLAALWIWLSSQEEVGEKSRKPKRGGERERKRERERARERRSPVAAHATKLKYKQWPLQRGTEREQRPDVGVGATDLWRQSWASPHTS